MLAVDTNVIVRYLTRDDEAQSVRARRIIDGDDVFVGTTVLLETEWVLRSAFSYDTGAVASALRAFCGLERVTLEEPGRVAQALDWMEAGMDFADALHLSNAVACEAFITFDRRFVRAANKLGVHDVRLP